MKKGEQRIIVITRREKDFENLKEKNKRNRGLSSLQDEKKASKIQMKKQKEQRIIVIARREKGFKNSNEKTKGTEDYRHYKTRKRF